MEEKRQKSTVLGGKYGAKRRKVRSKEEESTEVIALI